MTEQDPTTQVLTIEDRDNLSADMLVNLHCAERHMTMIELSYVQEIRDTDEYRYLVKKHGKASAEATLFAQTHRILRNDERYQISQLMRHIGDVHKDMQRIFNAAMEHGTLNGYDNMDPLMVEVNRLCYIQNLLRNISDEDMLRAVSTLKALAKGNQVSDRIMERLNKTLTF